MENTSKTKPSGKVIEIILGILILMIAIAIGFMLLRRPKEVSEDPIFRLNTEEYNAFFASMYDISSYSEEDFAYYRGLQTTVLQANFKNAAELTPYVEAAFQSGNSIESVYLGLDPYALWQNVSRKEEKWNTELDALMEQIDNYPDVLFEILLPYPPLSYWTSLPEKKLDEALWCYEELGGAVLVRPNTSLHFSCSEEWLIANPENYGKTFCSIDENLAHRLFLLNFCEKMYVVNEESFDEKLYELNQYILSEKDNPTKYADFSDTYFVFFGDSVMTYEIGTSSIPGVVFGLSNSQGANLSQGGSPATQDPAAKLSFERMVDGFLKKDASDYDPETDYYKGLTKFIDDFENGVLKKKKICFVICLGLNDFFGAHPVSNPSSPLAIDNYSGALTNGIKQLKEAYPDSNVLIMTPSYTKLFEAGTQKAGENGGILLDYVEAAYDVANQLQVDCADVYHDSGINENTYEEYLAADGVHPNELGRYILGRFLVNHLGGANNEP